jgi:myosin-5
VYGTSTSAYAGMKMNSINQSILVSGESGAGKTETVKILMNHIAQISGSDHDTTIEKVFF